MELLKCYLDEELRIRMPLQSLLQFTKQFYRCFPVPSSQYLCEMGGVVLFLFIYFASQHLSPLISSTFFLEPSSRCAVLSQPRSREVTPPGQLGSFLGVSRQDAHTFIMQLAHTFIHSGNILTNHQCRTVQHPWSSYHSTLVLPPSLFSSLCPQPSVNSTSS